MSKQKRPKSIRNFRLSLVEADHDPQRARDRVSGDQLVDAVRAVRGTHLEHDCIYGFAFTTREAPEGFVALMSGRKWSGFEDTVLPPLLDYCRRKGLTMPSLNEVNKGTQSELWQARVRDEFHEALIDGGLELLFFDGETVVYSFD